MTLAENTTTGTAFARAMSSAFPPDFLWGVATSAYQIEGATREDGRAPSIWDRFAATPGKTLRGESGDVADDHYHRMVEDVELMARLGVGAYRFSVAWPRVLPEGRGAVNAAGLDFYDRLVDQLLSRGITAAPTLYHWDLPVALDDEGGWLNRATAEAFAEYAEVMAQRLGDRVDLWITLNEPWCAAFLGYAAGVHAPGHTNAQEAVTAAHHLLLAHGLAVPRIRAHMKPGARLGATLDFSPFYPADQDEETLREADKRDRARNRWFMEPICTGHYPPRLFEDHGLEPPPMRDGDMAIISAPLDFIGVNYYSRGIVHSPNGGGVLAGEQDRRPAEHIPGHRYTEMGWEVFPEGLTTLLARLHRDYTPPALIVTENGAAFGDQVEADGSIHDVERTEYLRDHIAALAEARRQGVPLVGYFVWSLLDNYEWAEGYSKRFGIVYVDYETQQRTVKDSGWWYADFLRAL